MAENNGATTATQDSPAASAVKKLLDLLGPEPSPGGEEPPKPGPVVDELYGGISAEDITAYADGARGAAERYRNAMRWLVGAVAAIGIALFGSAAFITGDPLGSGEARWGLALASVGLVGILMAATLVFEPEDASLGELAEDIGRARRKLKRVGWGGWGEWYRKTKLFLSPRLAATWRLANILEGEEGSAHLGPGRTTVRKLIESIGEAEAERAVPAKNLADLRAQLAANVSAREVVAAELKAVLDARSAMDKDAAVPPPAVDTAIAALLDGATTLRDEATGHYGQLAAKQTELAGQDHQLGTDLLHRDLVLSESAVAQLRGTFRLSRRLLLIGALLTLVGAIFYISGVKGTDEPVDQFVRAGTMTVPSASPVADELPGKCLDEPLSVTYFAKATPRRPDAFEITVTAPADCDGTYEIPAGRSEDDIDLHLEPAVTVPTSE